MKMQLYHRHYDAEYRLHYYYCADTGESLWVCPSGFDVKVVLHPDEDPPSATVSKGAAARARSRSPHAPSGPASPVQARGLSPKQKAASPTAAPSVAALSPGAPTSQEVDVPLLTAPVARSPPAALLRPLPSLAALSGAIGKGQREGAQVSQATAGSSSHGEPERASSSTATPTPLSATATAQAASPYMFDPSISVRSSGARNGVQEESASRPSRRQSAVSPATTTSAQQALGHASLAGQASEAVSSSGNPLFSRLARTAASVMQGSTASAPSSPLQYVADLLEGGGVHARSPPSHTVAAHGSSPSGSPPLVTMSGDDTSVSPRVALSHAAASRVFGNPLDGRASELLCALLGQEWMKGPDPAAAILAGTAPAGAATLVAPRAPAVSTKSSESRAGRALDSMPTHELQAIVARHTGGGGDGGQGGGWGRKAAQRQETEVDSNSSADAQLRTQTFGASTTSSGRTSQAPWRGPTVTSAGTPTVRPLGVVTQSASPPARRHVQSVQKQARGPPAAQVQQEEESRRAAHGVTVRSALAGRGSSTSRGTPPVSDAQSPPAPGSSSSFGLAFTGPGSPGQAAHLAAQGMVLGPEYWHQPMDMKPLPGMPARRDHAIAAGGSSSSPPSSASSRGPRQEGDELSTQRAVSPQAQQARGRATARENALSQQLLPALTAALSTGAAAYPSEDGLAGTSAGGGGQGSKRTPTPPRPKSLHGRGRRPVGQPQLQYSHPYPYFEEDPAAARAAAVPVVMESVASSPVVVPTAEDSSVLLAAASTKSTASSAAKSSTPSSYPHGRASVQANKVAGARALRSPGSMSAMDRAALAAVMLATTPLDDESLAAAGAW